MTNEIQELKRSKIVPENFLNLRLTGLAGNRSVALLSDESHWRKATMIEAAIAL
jgi:hypothetical protein